MSDYEKLLGAMFCGYGEHDDWSCSCDGCSTPNSSGMNPKQQSDFVATIVLVFWGLVALSVVVYIIVMKCN